MIKSLFTFLLLVFILPSSNAANGEVGTLVGKITDKANQPISGANLVVKGTVRRVATDDNVALHPPCR